MRRVLQKPVVGQIARYERVYRPHWEIAHIGVRVSRWRKIIVGLVIFVVALTVFWLELLPRDFLLFFGTWLAVVMGIPAEERWAPSFSPGTSPHQFPEDFDSYLEDMGGPIEFEGIVTARGKYGHKGIMHRRVEIVRVLRYVSRPARASRRR